MNSKSDDEPPPCTLKQTQSHNNKLANVDVGGIDEDEDLGTTCITRKTRKLTQNPPTICETRCGRTRDTSGIGIGIGNVKNKRKRDGSKYNAASTAKATSEKKAATAKATAKKKTVAVKTATKKKKKETVAFLHLRERVQLLLSI